MPYRQLFTYTTQLMSLFNYSCHCLFHTHRASFHQAAKLVATLLRVAGVTAGMAESVGSLPPGL